MRKRQVREERLRERHTQSRARVKSSPWLFLVLPRKCTTVPFPSLPANMCALPEGRESPKTQVQSWDTRVLRMLPSCLSATAMGTGPLLPMGSTWLNSEPVP